MKLGTWLLALVEPLLGRILVALGFSVVSITGMTAVVNGLKASAVSALGLISPDTLNLFILAGGSTGLGIIFGACTTKLALWSIQNASKIIGVNPT